MEMMKGPKMLQKSLNAAVLSTLGAILVLPACAHASVISLSDQNFTVTTSAAQISNGGKTSATKSATTSFNQFDASKGVLTGVTISATTANTSKQENTLSVTYNKNAMTGNTTSTVQSTASLSATGASSSATAAQTQTTISCKRVTSPPGQSAYCGNGPTLTSSSATVTANGSGALNNPSSASVAAASLNSYVGAGKVTVTETLAVSSANASDAINVTSANTTADATWNGTVGLAYTYQDHAAAAFVGTAGNTLNLDFGSVYQGDAVAGLGFSLANLLGDRVALSLTGFSESGDTANLFSTNLAAFDNLIQGSSKAFEADFLSSTVGKYNASYTLTFADYAPDAASSTLSSGSTLTLNLSGEVLAKQAPATGDVPEPASLMLLGLGAAALGFGRKRRQR
jgi:hypothetical protein